MKYIALLRPKTLLLAFSIVVCGNALAFYQGNWQNSVFVLNLLTAVLLQILSNITNDYGDGIRGTDDVRENTAPKSLFIRGVLSKKQVELAILICLLCCLCSGFLLLMVSTTTWAEAFSFAILGLLSIIAAIFYTFGRFAYGYYGFGEISVFIFFGLIGVYGSYALQVEDLYWQNILPACGAGFLTAAILHINNTRDIHGDKIAGKITVAVRLGFKGSKFFHLFLLTSGFLCYFLFALIVDWKSMLWVVTLPFFAQHISCFMRAHDVSTIGAEFKRAVLLIFIFHLLFSISLVFLC